MDSIKQELPKTIDNKTSIKNTEEKHATKTDIVKLSSFQCSVCKLQEKYDYFGMNPPYMKNYILLEDSYVIEDPFLPPKQGEYLMLGANCTKCKKSVCKDQGCNLYFNGTICINCAQQLLTSFPRSLQDKINKLIHKC